MSSVRLACAIMFCCPKDNPLAGERMRLREELRASDPLDNNGGNGDNDCGVGLGWLEGGACGGAGQGDY